MAAQTCRLRPVGNKLAGLQVQAGMGPTLFCSDGIAPGWLEALVADLAKDADFAFGMVLRSSDALESDVATALAERIRSLELLSGQTLSDCQLVVGELLANAVLHGNLRDIPPHLASAEMLGKAVALLVGLPTGRVQVSVISETRGKSPGRKNVERAGPDGSLTVGGYGLEIIRLLAKSVTHSEDYSFWSVEFDGGNTPVV